MAAYTADEAAQLKQLLLEEIRDGLAGRVNDLGVESVAGWS